jgi:hypothetical protein
MGRGWLNGTGGRLQDNALRKQQCGRELCGASYDLRRHEDDGKLAQRQAPNKLLQFRG